MKKVHIFKKQISNKAQYWFKVILLIYRIFKQLILILIS